MQPRIFAPDDGEGALTVRAVADAYAILRGIELATLAELLGHKGTRTTSHYIHLAGQTEHLRAAIDRAVGPKTT